MGFFFLFTRMHVKLATHDSYIKLTYFIFRGRLGCLRERFGRVNGSESVEKSPRICLVYRYLDDIIK